MDESSSNDTINYDERWEIIMEPYEMLERKFGYWSGCPNMVACSSGTAALHLALECLKLPPGSEVLVPDFAFISCARAVTLAGLVPVFVDVNRDDLLIDLKLLQQYVEKHPQGSSENLNIAAILAVHTYGRQCGMDDICSLALKEGLYVIEDLAEAHSVTPHPRTDVSVWSFHKSKVVHGEEGGAISFRDTSQYSTPSSPGIFDNVAIERTCLAKCLRTLGHSKQGDYVHTPRGHNYRMSNLHAHAILDSLAVVDRNLQKRRQIEAWYDTHCPGSGTPGFDWRMPARDVPWTYDIRIQGMSQDAQTRVIAALQATGIEARYPFKPLHCQEEYHKCRIITADPNLLNCQARLASQEIIRLPINPLSEPWRIHKTARECFDLIRQALSQS